MSQSVDMNQLLDMLVASSRQGDWKKVESLARQWMAQKKFFTPHLFLIQALVATQRLDEADREFEDLMSYKFNIADRMEGFPALQARYRERLERTYILNTMRPNISFEIKDLPAETRKWDVSPRTETKTDFMAEARWVLDCALPGIEKADRRTSSVCTFGSCFAANLARMMIAQGMNASNLLIEESINSTYANRVLMKSPAGSRAGRPTGTCARNTAMHSSTRYGRRFPAPPTSS